MDVQMPLMDGFQCSRAIRKYEETKGLPHVPIVARPRRAATPTAKTVGRGMDDFLAKPSISHNSPTLLKKWLRPKMSKIETEEVLVKWSVLEKLAELKADGPTARYGFGRGIFAHIGQPGRAAGRRSSQFKTSSRSANWLTP